MINSHTQNILMMLSNPYRPDLRVCKEAKSLVAAGYNVTIFAWDREGTYKAEEIINGIRIRRIRIRAPYSTGVTKFHRMFLFWLMAVRLAKNQKFSVVHCHDLDTLSIGVFFRIFYGTKLIYDAHEKFSRMVLINSSTVISYLVEIYEKILVRFVDSFIVASTKLGEEWERHAKNRVVVIGNWQNLQVLNSELVKRIRRRLKKRSRLLIAYIGILDLSRDILPMINAVESIPQVQFFICGDGTQRAEIEEAASRIGNVSYLGLVPLDMVPYYTAAADVVYYGLNPMQPISKYQAPNSLGFALTTGRAVLGSNHGEIGTTVNRFKCGILFQDNSRKSITAAIQTLMDRRFLKICQRNSLRAAQSDLNWGRMAQRLTNHYKKLLIL
jgi:glycosyltransferase involved in cell wall biosynthesis